jgi:hypothetical protein
MTRGKERQDPAQKNFEAGVGMVKAHPVFAPLLRAASLYRGDQPCRKHCRETANGLVHVTADGHLYCHSSRRTQPAAWARAIAHCLLHLGMGHFVVREHPRLWNLACDLVVEKFLSDLRFATPIADIPLPGGINDEERLYRRLAEQGIREVTGVDAALFGAAGDNESDMLFPVEGEKGASHPLMAFAASAFAVAGVGKDGREPAAEQGLMMKAHVRADDGPARALNRIGIGTECALELAPCVGRAMQAPKEFLALVGVLQNAENADDLFVEIVVHLDSGARLAQEDAGRAAVWLDIDTVRRHIADDPGREHPLAPEITERGAGDVARGLEGFRVVKDRLFSRLHGAFPFGRTLQGARAGGSWPSLG